MYCIGVCITVFCSAGHVRQAVLHRSAHQGSPRTAYKHEWYSVLTCSHYLLSNCRVRRSCAGRVTCCVVLPQMVPQYAPEAALTFFSRYLTKTPY